VKEVIAFVPWDLEADETWAVFRRDWLVTLTAMNLV
jgi:hypothetical protein